MSYYDNTVASYDSQITNNYERIDEYNSQIRQLEDDIEDLKQLNGRVKKVDDAVEAAANTTSNKINNLPAVVTNPFSFLKMNYFSSFLDVLKGSSERIRSNNSISSAFDKIKIKIHELEDKIQSLRDAIKQCNHNISSLRRQRTSYITNMERKIAEENAARQRAAEARQREVMKETVGVVKEVVNTPIATCPNQTNNLPNPGKVISDIFKKR